MNNNLNQLQNCMSEITPQLLHTNNANLNNTSRLPLFNSSYDIFNSYGKIWCLNSENQNRCQPDRNYILVPNSDVLPNEIYNDVNNLKYSNNVINSIVKNDSYINKGIKLDSTGINITASNNYTFIDTSNNPYPANSNFTPDNISLQKLNEMNTYKLNSCNNNSIENRFRPVYLHVPNQFLEICEPIGYQKRTNAAGFTI